MVRRAAATFLPSAFNILKVDAACIVLEASTTIPLDLKYLINSGDSLPGKVSPHPTSKKSFK